MYQQRMIELAADCTAGPDKLQENPPNVEERARPILLMGNRAARPTREAFFQFFVGRKAHLPMTAIEAQKPFRFV
jgi:hypothetical protein